MTQQETTKQDINKLIEFRQAIYAYALLARRDALFDLLDALICEGAVSSFPLLSQSSRFQRKWPSLYTAVEDGELDSQWLRNYLAWQVPQKGVCVFPMDGSPWPRPRSRVLDDRQYVYQASSDVNGGTVTVGYPYSLLEWCAEPHSSWSLPVDVRRVPSTQTAQEVGAAPAEPSLPVMFRVSKDADREVAAVFPTLPGTNDPSTVTVYAHVGQHGSAPWSYARDRTRPATEAEYAPLLREVRSIYEGGPDPVRLRVVQRATRAMYDERRRAAGF